MSVPGANGVVPLNEAYKIQYTYAAQAGPNSLYNSVVGIERTC